MLLVAMTRTGRPTQDPKNLRISLRLADRDGEALDAIARKYGVSISEAARRVLRTALGVSALPKRKRKRRPHR